MSPRNAPGRTDARTIGFIVAIAIAVVSAGVVGFFVIRGAGSSGDTSADLDHEPPVPDIRDLAADPINPGSPGFGGGSELYVQFTDREDPTRLAGELTSSTVEPLPDKRYRADAPRAWMYLRDGRTLHLEAERGNFFWPDRARGGTPESGVFSGDVVITLYDPVEGRRADPERDEPVLTARTDPLRFDFAIGELSTPGRVEVTSEAIDFAGTDARVVFREAQERIDLLEVRQGEYIRYRPATRTASSEAESQPTQAQRPPATSGPRANTPAAAEDAVAQRTRAQDPALPEVDPERSGRQSQYRIVFEDQVVVAQDDLSIEADTLEAWVRLIDNQLPEGAVGPRRAMRRVAPALASAPGAASALAHALAHASVSARSDTLASDDEVVLTWTGPLSVRPIGPRAEQLRDDDLTLRFTAVRTGLVKLRDADSGATGRAATLDYRATSRDLALSGPGERTVRLDLPGRGRVETHRIELDAAVGIAHIPGPGVANLAPRDDQDPRERRRLSWTDQADLQFQVRDGQMTGALREAMFTGGVDGAYEGGRVRGDFMHAFFEPVDDNTSHIRRLVVRGSVDAEDGRGGQFRAESADLSFDYDSVRDEPVPRLLTGEGDVVASRPGERLRAESMDVRLAPEPEGDGVRVEHLVATHNVRFDRADGVAARADVLRADAGTEVADLEGEQVTVARGDTQIQGRQIRLDGGQRRLTVFGAGTFTHRDGDARGGIDMATAEWLTEMTFDDAAGIVDCVGEAHAVAHAGEMSTDTLRAERVRVHLSPHSDDARPQRDDPDALDPGEAPRRILAVRAAGSVLDREGGDNARVEARRYQPDATTDEGRRLTRLFYLEGPEILADNEQGTLDVPHPGRLLVADRRQREQDSRAGSSADPFASDGDGVRGTSLFNWEGDMRMTRRDGRLVMTRNVRLLHRRPGDDIVTELECERLTSRLRERARETDAQTDPDAIDAELIEARAEGAVYLRAGQRELIADTLLYNADEATVEADAAEGNAVTVFDDGLAAPISASRLFWDLRRDRMEVRQPGPITTPR